MKTETIRYLDMNTETTNTEIYKDTPEALLRLILEEVEPECSCQLCIHCRISKVLGIRRSQPLIGESDWEQHRRELRLALGTIKSLRAALREIVNYDGYKFDFKLRMLSLQKIAAVALENTLGGSQISLAGSQIPACPPHVAAPAEDRGDVGDIPSEGGQPYYTGGSTPVS